MINGVRETKSYINRQGRKLGKAFKKEIINRTRQLSFQMQKELSESVDRGAVPFTNRAIMFTYKQSVTGVSCTILVKDIQAKYLRGIIEKQSLLKKFVPTSAARLTKFGNISGMKANIANGRYKIVKKGTKERLIDTRQKKRGKRIIATKASKKRKQIYDFYEKGEQGMRAIISETRGYFTIRK